MTEVHGNVPHYSMVIQWSDDDDLYLVTLPEWQDRLIGRAVAHGATYAEAAKSGQILLELLIEGALSEGEPLPEAHTFPAIV